MLRFFVYENTENISDSLEFDSGTIIAMLTTDNFIATIEVRGEVIIDFCEKGTFDDETPIFSRYRKPSEFPLELKKLIKDGKIKDIDGNDYHWTFDRRINMVNNNWFELIISTRDGYTICSDCVDIEGLSESEILTLLLENVNQNAA